PASRTAKVVFFTAGVPAAEAGATKATRHMLVLGLVRGDMELNETKLSNAIRARWLRPATPAEIAAVGAEAGYGSPIGIKREGALVVVDDQVAATPNLVSGANEPHFHFRNVCVGREFTPDQGAGLDSD